MASLGGTVDGDAYRDKVYACWIGKNCGGTLGAPLEELFGRDELFDVHWYPQLREGGIPNDDLELQLIMLKAVEEQGFGLTARDLARYWLDHVGYNFDEYGLAKTNLRLGLAPPLSGAYNNWFRDCMGAPIRSELWACIAPGHPALAVHYAYEDASVDHAGGEGVWGELFNAAVESAAFVQRDPQTLLDIGLSYIPPDCATARAVRAARAAHRAGVDWRAARQRVLAAAPSPIAQYAPPNIGFQVIGWLYGADFGDALCTAVNCGYDTDCTGATLGALLGILGGTAALPSRWTAPLGEAIATNASWGGLRAVSTGRNPVPATLGELTTRVCALGKRLLALQDTGPRIAARTEAGASERATGRLSAPHDAATRWWTASTARSCHDLGTLSVEIECGDAPVIAPGVPRRIGVRLRNGHPASLAVDVQLTPPPGWSVEPAGPRQLDVPGDGVLDLSYTVRADHAAAIHNTNRLLLVAQPRERPAELAAPVVLLGSRRWLLRRDPPEGEQGATLVNRLNGSSASAMSPGGALLAGPDEDWSVATAPDNALPTAIGDDWTGTLHARLFLWNPPESGERRARLGIPATCPRALWLNGRPIHEARDYGVLRPNYGHAGGDGVSYVDGTLLQGWNEVLVTYTRAAGAPPFAAHFTLSTPDMYDGIVDVEWTRLPWDDEQ